MDDELAVILDLTSLTRLAGMIRLPNVPKEERIHLGYRAGDVDTAIEALVLYDSVLLDGHAWETNLEKIPELAEFSRLCQPIPISPEKERQIYESLTSNFVNRLVASIDNYDGLCTLDTVRSILLETGIRFPLGGGFGSFTWDELENGLSEGPATAIRSLKHRFGLYSQDASAACLLLLRTLYYHELQSHLGSDLILHPIRGVYFQSKPRIGANILGIFDQTIRSEFEARKREWLGQHNPNIELPLLTSYVFSKCDTWKNLSNVIEEVRSQDAAVDFRNGLRTLRTAIDHSDNKIIDEILRDLKSANEKWAKNLNAEGPKRKLHISVPYIGISTDIEVPKFRVRKRPGEKMLVFIHTLLCEA